MKNRVWISLAGLALLSLTIACDNGSVQGHDAHVVAQVDAGGDDGAIIDATQVADAGSDDSASLDDAGTQEDARAQDDAGSLAPPAAPTNLQAELHAGSEVLLTWQDNSDNESAFVLAISQSDDFADSALFSLGAELEQYNVNTLIPNQLYYFRLRAINNDAASGWSNTQSLLTLDYPFGNFVISGGLSGTNGDQVSLDSSMHYVDELRFQAPPGEWSEWQAYADSIPLDISALNDSLLYVTMQYRNSIGDIVTREDSLIINRTPPSVNDFMINDNAAITSSRSVSLNCDHVDEAFLMRFRDDHSLVFGDWQDYEPTIMWNLSPTNGSRTVYAEFADAYGNVATASDSIIYTPATENIEINDGNLYSNARQVSLSLHSSSATQFKLRNEDTNTWSDAIGISGEKEQTWTLSEGDGVKIVFVTFIDNSNNETQAQDAITLDSQPPALDLFAIDEDAASCTTPHVALSIMADGAAQMAFSTDDGATWTDWERAQIKKELDLFADNDTQREINEDHVMTVRIRLRDQAGNISEGQDSIVFDSTTRLLITLVRIDVSDDGDTFGSGEWGWYAYANQGYADRHHPINYLNFGRDSDISVDDGDHININSSIVYVVSNAFADGQPNSWNLIWRVNEKDTFNNTLTVFGETYEYPYTTGSFSHYFYTNEGSGTQYWTIERLDQTQN